MENEQIKPVLGITWVSKIINLYWGIMIYLHRSSGIQSVFWDRFLGWETQKDAQNVSKKISRKNGDLKMGKTMNPMFGWIGFE